MQESECNAKYVFSMTQVYAEVIVFTCTNVKALVRALSQNMTSRDYKECMNLQECKPQQTTHLFITLTQFIRRDSATVMLQNMFSIPVALQAEYALAMPTRGISHLQKLKWKTVHHPPTYES